MSWTKSTQLMIDKWTKFGLGSRPDGALRRRLQAPGSSGGPRAVGSTRRRAARRRRRLVARVGRPRPRGARRRAAFASAEEMVARPGRRRRPRLHAEPPPPAARRGCAGGRQARDLREAARARRRRGAGARRRRGRVGRVAARAVRLPLLPDRPRGARARRERRDRCASPAARHVPSGLASARRATTTGASTRSWAAPRARSPTSARTGATSPSSSPAIASRASRRACSPLCQSAVQRRRRHAFAPAAATASRAVTTEDAALVQFETDARRARLGRRQPDLRRTQEPALDRARRDRGGARVRPGAPGGALVRASRGADDRAPGSRPRCRPARRASRRCPPATRRATPTASTPSWRTSTRQSRAGSTIAGTPTFADGLRAAPITDAVLPPLARSAGSTWPQSRGGGNVKLGFLTSCMPERSLEDIAAWAAANRFEALELAAWPQLGDRPFTASHVRADAFDETRARARPQGARRQRSRALRARVLRQQPRARRRRARGVPRAPARLHRRRSCARRRSRRHVHRPRPRTHRRREPSRSRAVFPPLVEYAGERGVRLMIENCVMEGWHPDGYPGNLAYSPELWEWMFRSASI